MTRILLVTLLLLGGCAPSPDGRYPAPVRIDGISYRATDPSLADEVTYLFEDER